MASQFLKKKTNIKSWRVSYRSVTSTLNAFLKDLKTSKTHKTKLASPELSLKLYLRIILMKKTIKKMPIRSCKIKIMAHKKVNQASRSHLWLWKATK